MSTIKFGPAGLGPVKEAIFNLEEFHRLGLKACEISFTHGAYIKEKEDSLKIGKVAKELGISLSIHAPYYINLNSKETEKIEASKKRILKCCEIAHYLEAKRVVFHPGFYSNMKSEEASINIKKSIIEMMTVIKKKWDVELCPEIMGKVNVFGSIDEIADLVKDTGCGFCIDFAHVLARYGEHKFEEIKKAFPQKKWHAHFSGIEYNEKGEKNHKKTDVKEWINFLNFLKKLDKDIIIICESPDPINDSIAGKSLTHKN
ncbi:TIM barrel protein [Candidatus Pacearchaeota archaeon]|nr:TIM barrel protein [Candidatus Pacearchaeota archaeon]